MDEDKQQQTAADTTAAPAAEAVPAPATGDIAQDDQVLIVGSTFSASMTPEIFARVLRESDRLAAEQK